MSRIIDAVSVVLTCRDEMFAIQRQNFLSAFPGYWAFPGGKVDKGDASFSIEHPLCPGVDQKLIGAVVREVQEELGVDLRQELLNGGVRSFDLLGLAVTPDFNPYRFATYFFKIDLSRKIDFIVDQNEAQLAEWRSSPSLLEAYDKGELLAVPPVIKVIESLGKDPDIKRIDNLNFLYDEANEVPYIESLRGIKQLMPLSNTLPPAVRTNCFLIGDEKCGRVLVDPSPRDKEEYRKLKNTVSRWGIDKIFITHHHPDHFERADDLAREFEVPVLLSAFTQKKILAKNPLFFEGLKVQIVKENEIVTRWLGKEVLIMEVPGHDEGQLALYDSNLSWFLAGDLFQGIGTVVIGGDEGDMQKYFSTLERIIQLTPKVVFPSHGIGLGGTYILEKTLAHRKEREEQIFRLHSSGQGPDEILKSLYRDVDTRLWPYALQNIHKHLEKLKKENRIND